MINVRDKSLSKTVHIKCLQKEGTMINLLAHTKNRLFRTIFFLAGGISVAVCSAAVTQENQEHLSFDIPYQITSAYKQLLDDTITAWSHLRELVAYRITQNSDLYVKYGHTIIGEFTCLICRVGQIPIPADDNKAYLVALFKIIEGEIAQLNLVNADDEVARVLQATVAAIIGNLSISATS